MLLQDLRREKIGRKYKYIVLRHADITRLRYYLFDQFFVIINIERLKNEREKWIICK